VRVSRRAFLRWGAAAGTGFYGLAGGPFGAGRAWASMLDLASTPGAPGVRLPGSRPRPDLPAGTDTIPAIQHIVVLMMENHSFDNYLGLLGRGDGFTVGPDGRLVNTARDAAGRPVRPFHLPSTCQTLHRSLQSWNASHIALGDGHNEGFGRSPGGPAAMGYWTPADLPFYSGLARTFPLADRWFASCLGPTHPNRRFLIAGTAGGTIHNHDAVSSDPPPPSGTVFNLLDAHNLTWRNYYVTVPTAALYMKAVHRPANLVPVGRFFADAKAGTLPNFSIVDPDYRSTSEETPFDITVGEAFSASVINAILQSPAWPRTVLIWCYDEHGGYYDHVPPPPAIPPDAVPAQLGRGDARAAFDRYGFRVPAVVVSPFARPNYVSHVIHDHTSVLKLVETKWNLPALTYRDANASNLLDCLDLSAPAFGVPPRLPLPANAAGSSRCVAAPPAAPSPANGRTPVQARHAGTTTVAPAPGGSGPASDDGPAPFTVGSAIRPIDDVGHDRLIADAPLLLTAAVLAAGTSATVLAGRNRIGRLATAWLTGRGQDQSGSDGGKPAGSDGGEPAGPEPSGDGLL
jgi:phospholipase C